MKPQRRYLLFRQFFKTPLLTSRGLWRERTSLILRKDDEIGNIFFGEVAPLQGSLDENFHIALQEAKLWSESDEELDHFVHLAPALACLNSTIWKEPINNKVLPATARLWGVGESTFNGVIKRKVGLFPAKKEIPVILDWLQGLSNHIQVRLDPNESFSREDLLRWTDALAGNPSIQFIEQPTGFRDDDWLIDHSLESPVPIALDEALLRVKFAQDLLKLPKNLYLVIKPILFRDWEMLYKVFADKDRKIIFSTAFESPFGYEAVLRLCRNSFQVPGLERSFFKGNTHEFSEHHNSTLSSPTISNDRLAFLWDLLSG